MKYVSVYDPYHFKYILSLSDQEISYLKKLSVDNVGLVSKLEKLQEYL